jgi:hypothetical protein
MFQDGPKFLSRNGPGPGSIMPYPLVGIKTKMERSEKRGKGVGGVPEKSPG